jgi:hypothetical protein
MDILVNCPSCAVQFKYGAQQVGNKTKCRKCGHIFRVPEITALPHAKPFLPSTAHSPADKHSKKALQAVESDSNGKSPTVILAPTVKPSTILEKRCNFCGELVGMRLCCRLCNRVLGDNLFLWVLFLLVLIGFGTALSVPLFNSKASISNRALSFLIAIPLALVGTLLALWTWQVIRKKSLEIRARIPCPVCSAELLVKRMAVATSARCPNPTCAALFTIPVPTGAGDPSVGFIAKKELGRVLADFLPWIGILISVLCVGLAYGAIAFLLQVCGCIRQ